MPEPGARATASQGRRRSLQAGLLAAALLNGCGLDISSPPEAGRCRTAADCRDDQVCSGGSQFEQGKCTTRNLCRATVTATPGGVGELAECSGEVTVTGTPTATMPGDRDQP